MTPPLRRRARVFRARRAGLSYVRDVVLSADGLTYAYQYRRWLSDLYVVEGLK